MAPSANKKRPPDEVRRLATTAINDEHEMAYRRAIYLSALQNDLERMPAGDATEIGEKCINLSGGQKARANLAHALSSDASVLLMDDILAAVDAHVAALLFHACIKSSLHGKARVLVTHSLSNAAQCNYIVLMESSRIAEHGAHGHDFFVIVRSIMRPSTHITRN